MTVDVPPGTVAVYTDIGRRVPLPGMPPWQGERSTWPVTSLLATEGLRVGAS